MLTRTMFALLPALTLGGAGAFAQAVTPETSSSAPDRANEDIVVLSPFQVDTTQDKGYRATNATSGTRLNTEIKDVPLNLEVITSQFIQDTGSTNLREALRYSAGIVLESQSDAFTDEDSNPQGAGANDPRGATRRPGDSTTKLRGFIIDQVLRDGFRRQYSADAVNIERVEVLRGPSALLYGVGNFGGVINYIPKRPLHESQRSIGFTIGTDNLYRGEFDFTGPLGDGAWKPAYRITGAYEENEDYTDFYEQKHYTIAPSFSFRPFPKTEVLLDNEFGYKEESGVGFQNIRNNVGDEGQGPGRQATWITDLFDPETSLKIGERVDNRTFRWSGPDTYLKGPFRNHIVDVTQQIGEDLFLKVGFAQSEATFDSRQAVDAHGTRGFFSTAADLARAPALYGPIVSSPISRQAANSAPELIENAVIEYEWKDYNTTELRNQIRAEATYKLDLGKWGTHTFLTGVQYMELESDEDEYGPAYSYGGNPVNRTARYSYKNPTDYTPFRYGVQGDGVPDNPAVHLYYTNQKTHDLGYYGVYQGQFFNKRLTLIGGMRWDRNDAREVKNYIYEATHAAEYLSRVSDDAPTATSPQVGISYAVTPSLSVFGLYSTGVVPNYYERDGNGDLLEPTEARNYEAGIKFDLADGRVSGTISAFRTEREGVPKFIWWAPSNYQNQVKGYDSALPSTTVLWYATPDAFWEGLHNSGMSVEQATAVAKDVWPTGWHPLIDEIAASPTKQTDWANYGPLAGTFWNYAWQAEAPTNDQTDTGNFYFPLANYSDPDVAAFMAAIHSAPGWKGNYFYTAGYPYRYGNGTVGYGNAPDGSGAYVRMDDESSGWDASIIFTPTDELQILAGFAHVDRKITTRTYQFVDAPYWPAGWWFASDNNFGTLDNTKLAPDVYTDIYKTSTYNQTIPDYGNAADDTPRNTASLWIRYSLDKLADPLKGWTVGAGGTWEDNRMWFTGFSGGGGNVTYEDGTRELVKLYTKERYRVNAFVEYKTKLQNKYPARFALNVDNLLDDQDLYGLVYAPGISARFSARFEF